jgi:glycosyltransferase involved in cell wall biosynthesis
MKVSIIVPCFNEKKSICEILSKIKQCGIAKKEVIIVDDFSSDGTREILKVKYKKDKTFKIIFHDFNKGKGAALRSGIKVATGDIIIFQDADLEYDPQEYKKLIAPIQSGVADVVFGSRFSGGESHRVVYFWHFLGNKFLTLLSNIFTNINLTDMETCYKIFKSSILKQIKIEECRFGIEPEITAKVAKLKCSIYEVGISYYGRTYEEGKKIGWRDGVRAIYVILKYNLFR